MKVTYIKTGKRVKTKSSNNYVDQKEDNENQKQKNVNKAETNKGGTFKTIFKKNQIVLLTLALMLVTAGYMNYNNSNNELNMSLAELGDAKLVNANVIGNNIEENEKVSNNEMSENDQTEENSVADENNTTETNSNNVENEMTETDNNGAENEITETSNNGEVNMNNSVDVNSNQDYYTQTRLERQTMYSQMLEAYQKILENEKIPADQKTIASNEIKNINDRINAISIIENLIKTKGFEDVVLLINDNNINVVVKQNDKLSDEQVAQITNIVSRELNAEIEDIHITMKP